MKRFLPLIILLFFCIGFSSKAFAQQGMTYNGTSGGPQIEVTYNGYGSLTVGYPPFSYYYLRVVWTFPGGHSNEQVYAGGTFYTYPGATGFRIDAQMTDWPYTVVTSEYSFYY